MTIQVMHEQGIDASSHESKHLEKFLGDTFDYIITVCDRANDNCPSFPGDVERIHWSFDDPAIDAGSPEEQHRVFKRIAREISERIRVCHSTA